MTDNHQAWILRRLRELDDVDPHGVHRAAALEIEQLAMSRSQQRRIEAQIENLTVLQMKDKLVSCLLKLSEFDAVKRALGDPDLQERQGLSWAEVVKNISDNLLEARAELANLQTKYDRDMSRLGRVRAALNKHRGQMAGFITRDPLRCGGDGCPGCYHCWSDDDAADRDVEDQLAGGGSGEPNKRSTDDLRTDDGSLASSGSRPELSSARAAERQGPKDVLGRELCGKAVGQRSCLLGNGHRGECQSTDSFRDVERQGTE